LRALPPAWLEWLRSPLSTDAPTSHSRRGYGYAGILVAFVARHRGLPIILVATLLGGILASGGILQREFQLPDATILVFQGLVFLAILFSDSLYGRFKCFAEETA